MVQTANAKWYVIRVAGNKEKSMSEKIKSELTATGLDKYVTNIIVPIEKQFLMKNGKKTMKEVILYPSYVLIETDNISEVRNMLKGLSGVSGFISDRAGNPQPLTKTDVQTMVGKLEEIEEIESNGIAPYIVGEKVKIIDGPFNGFVGIIEVADSEKSKLKVDVMIFGRKTPVELSYMQVTKQ
jgi:transcriptional antiterminator NusG